MIENKRFYLDENGINDREYEFSILGEDELVDIINELSDENEQLKKSNKYLQGQLEDYSGVEIDNMELREENEQLKQEIETLQEQLAHFDIGDVE